MKNAILLLFSLLFSSLLSAQSISLQIGSSLTPNFYTWAEYPPNKYGTSIATAFYYQPHIYKSKKMQFVLGIQMMYSPTIYRNIPPFYGDWGSDIVEVHTQTIFTELPFGVNIPLFSTPNKKWEFILQPSIISSFYRMMVGQWKCKHENGKIETYPYKNEISNNSVIFGAQLAQETRFHFAPKFYACAKVWVRSQYMLSSFQGGRDNNGLGSGLQVGIGYKWK